MKEYGMTVHQAYEKLRALIDEAWMEIVQGCLCKTQPMELLEKVVNVARVMDNMYIQSQRHHNFNVCELCVNMIKIQHQIGLFISMIHVLNMPP
jgi:hypothetical protein